MSAVEACCTCATLLSDTKVPYDTESEKPLVLDRKLDCCGRTICASCQYKNRRFETYCPFCQISSVPSAIPAEGLRLPPSYSNVGGNTRERQHMDEPPAYDSIEQTPSTSTNGGSPASRPPENTRDTVHFLSSSDTLHSISLAYSVPASVLRKHNALYSDNLLAARKFILVPESHYSGPSLSTPPDPEEEERKNKIRRWMVATKCPDYEQALLYLKGSEWDLDGAIEAFKADERWEKENPMHKDSDKKGKKRNKSAAAGLVGQLS